MTKRKDPADLQKRGRHSKYDPKFVKQAEQLCSLGATDAEMADFFEVSVVTLNAWKIEHPEFLKSIKDAKEVADNRVERSLYQRAVGYTFDAVKIQQFQGEVIQTPYKEHVPPDTTAQIFWLKNRRKDQWRDKQDHEVTGKDGAPLNPTIIFTGSPGNTPAPQTMGGAPKRGD